MFFAKQLIQHKLLNIYPFLERGVAIPDDSQGGSQNEFQEFTSLPETQDVDDETGVNRDYQDEVQDSGMEAGIDSGSDDDIDDDMIVLDPEHVRLFFAIY